MRYLMIRETVIATCRSLADKGFLAGTGGNVAVRADDQNLAVTPSATDYYSMAPEDVCIVRLKDLAKVDGRLHKMLMTAYEKVNEAAQEYQTDWRTAAYVVALTRLERTYKERGIFP